jgi:glycosyltransferase involved in cell wall biosynthesis
LHDTLPIGEAFQTHAKKFKGVLCLSEWHKNFFCEEFKFPRNLVHVTGNAIDVKRFEAKIQKIPYKFIFSSSPDRVLDNLLTIFPKIQEKYTSAELHIFGNESLLTRDTLRTISQYDYIKLHGRVSQQKISREYLSSDVWLYPTEFKETYCITALEAQVSKVLCVCTDLAGLSDTVSSRGVLVKGKASTRRFQNEILRKLFLVLDNRLVKEHLIEKAYKWAQQQTLENLAKGWNERFFKLM